MPLILVSPYRIVSKILDVIVGGLYAYGNNNSGQLGRGAATSNADETNWELVQIGSNQDWSVFSAGTSCAAIKSDGTLWTWGSNNYGQLGRSGNHLVPAQVTSTPGPWKDVQVVGSVMLALKVDGTLWACGLNNYGQHATGNADTNTNTILKKISGTWESFSLSGSFVHAIKPDGTLWSWGHNGSGQLGRNGTSLDLASNYIPGRVGTLSNWKKVSTGSSFFMVLDGTGALYGGGANNSGQMGKTIWYDRVTGISPLLIDKVKDVSLGSSHAVILKDDGTVWAWGSNDYGQLGRGHAQQDASYYIPIKIENRSDWSEIHANESTTILRDASGELFACGAGTYKLYPDRVNSKTLLTKLGHICARFSFGSGTLLLVR